MLAPALRAGADWRGQADAWAARGLRVVLFAGRPEPLAIGEPDGPPALPSDLVAIALIAFSDELRGGVQRTLEEFADAGIEVKIISGDNPGTVTALATQAGVHTLARRGGMDGYCEAVVGEAAAGGAVDPSGTAAGAGAAEAAGTTAGAAAAAGARELVAVSGAELEAMTPEEFGAAAERSTIFGRVTPEQKQDLVEALRERGRYVAMIGDGVNDVIALKQANVAVAMQGGSQAARSVGDLILMKDTFQPLPFAFREGQRIINGMNDILRIFMVRIFFKALLIAIVTAIGGFPFAPRQSALLSFVGATIPAIAFALWAQPGATPKVGLFKLLARFVAPTALLMAGIATGVYLAWSIPAHNAYIAAHPGVPEKELVELSFPQAQTALTIFACFAAILLILLIVPPTKWWAGGAPLVRGDWRIVAVVGALLAFMVAVLLIPVGRTAFELTALPLWQYVVLFALAVVWSVLCRLVWRSGVLDRWLGTAEDPGNYCAKQVPPKPV
jgi:cation-transporting ATPase E